jgi:glycosyltransferase involved in cell wall biosynthesis
MAKPLISVVMPARNEGGRVVDTIRSITATRSWEFPLEIVILDDASTDGCCTRLAAELPLLQIPNTSVRVLCVNKRLGVPRGRNKAAWSATSDILFITDAHVQFCQDWDRIVFEHLKDNRVLAATVADPESQFQGYGCRLVVPFMGTYWNREVPGALHTVQIAACIGTVLTRELFYKIGGYDNNMIFYGAAEPEFSVRAWLSGAEIVCVRGLEVRHRFKPKQERDTFIDWHRPFMIHNSLRFGMLYLSDLGCMQMIRYYAMKFPGQVQEGLQMLTGSDVWERRELLRSTLVYDFAWFVEKFGITDDVGRSLLEGSAALNSRIQSVATRSHE